MSTRTSTDWSLPAASFGAPVLGSDQSACPAFENYILISRSSCPTNGVHFSRGLAANSKRSSNTPIKGDNKIRFTDLLYNYERSKVASPKT
jgi:hypothetical protein